MNDTYFKRLELAKKFQENADETLKLLKDDLPKADPQIRTLYAAMAILLSGTALTCGLLLDLQEK